MKKFVPILAIAFAALLPRAASAQFAAPNRAGVAMGHVHLNVKDVEASRKFYLELGGSPVKVGANEGVRFPGVVILLRKADPSGEMEGSAVNHIGFLVKDGATLMAKMKSNGTKITTNGTDGHGGYIYSPDGAKLEIVERPALTVPIQFEQVHFFVADPAPDGGSSWAELQSWYTKIFGAEAQTTTLVPTKSGLPAFAQSVIPGVNLRFSKVDAVTVPTKGRALDHIGFEIKNLEAFCKNLEAQGVKLTMPYRVIPETGISLAFVTDPWGTYIELNEGLNKIAGN